MTNQCIRLIEALMNLSSDTSSQDVNTAAVSLTGTLGNIISVLKSYQSVNRNKKTLNINVIKRD